MKKLLSTTIAILTLGWLAAMAQADTIAYTGFEEPEKAGGRYTGVYTAPFQLENQADPTVVVDYAGGSELGFETWIVSAPSSGGPMASDETSGDYIGVQDYVNHTGGGSYEIEDADNTVELRLDSVDLTGYTDVSIGAWLKVLDTSYETADSIRLWADTDMGEFDLFNMSGAALAGYVGTGGAGDGYAWVYYSTALTGGVSSAQLMLTVTTSGSGEGAQLDDVSFDASPVPVPAAGWLLGTALVSLVGIRRRK